MENNKQTLENAVRLSRIVKAFNGKRVIDDLDLHIKKNEIISIIGPSGAGKTTLLRIIAGLEEPDNGIKESYGRVGMVFQHCYLWPHKTVMQNVAEPLIHIKKLNPKTAEKKASEILTKLNLANRLEQFPDTLSGGETQRVAIARSLVMDPEILLLDEITSALDPELVREVLNTLRKLAEEERTMIIVTHEMDFARYISDRVIFLENGKIVEEGHPHKIFTMPQQARTKMFLNLMR